MNLQESSIGRWFKNTENITLLFIWSFLFFIVGGVLFFGCGAYAQDTLCPPITVDVNSESQQQIWWMVLLDFLLQLVTPIAIAVLTTLSSIAINKWGKKLDLDKRQAFDSLLNSFITDGILFAEERGRKALKAGKEKAPGAHKLQMALDHVGKKLAEDKFPRMLQNDLIKLIEAKLHKERTKPDGIIASDPS